jgi:hypothetical protein
MKRKIAGKTESIEKVSVAQRPAWAPEESTLFAAAHTSRCSLSTPLKAQVTMNEKTQDTSGALVLLEPFYECEQASIL